MPKGLRFFFLFNDGLRCKEARLHLGSDHEVKLPTDGAVLVASMPVGELRVDESGESPITVDAHERFPCFSDPAQTVQP